jgi:hypothetical protein
MSGMTEDDLRGMVREAVAKRLAQPGLPTAPQALPAARGVPVWRAHASHVRLVLTTGRDQDGPCLIEPASPCSHCGYCQSYGH